jgi:hypothetical protein
MVLASRSKKLRPRGRLEEKPKDCHVPELGALIAPQPLRKWRMELASVVLLALVAVHLVLAGWATVGLIEWFRPTVPWPRLSNPHLLNGILFLHWMLMLLAGGVFLVGYSARWSGTPTALAIAYVCLAAFCAVESFGFLVHRSKFLDMALEYAAYAAIIVFLLRAAAAREHFGTAESHVWIEGRQ